MANTNRVYFITGASSGLGLALVRRLADAGVGMALFARRHGALDVAVGQAHERGAEAAAFPVDLADPTALHGAVDAALERFGGVDVLVNAAGWSPPLRPVLETPLETWDHALNLNARAGYLMSLHCLPAMLRRQRGHIVDVCTAVAPVSVAKVSAYRASKAAQRAFAQSLREELKGSGIRVLTVLPEPMDTPMRWEATPDYPRDRVLDPADVAAVIQALVTGPDGVAIDEVFVRVP